MCLFCVRHHSNPVGTKWKWKMDDPELIVKGALENHCQMIKQFKGMFASVAHFPLELKQGGLCKYQKGVHILLINTIDSHPSRVHVYKS